MELIQLLLGIIFLNVIYYTGKIVWAIHWGIHHQHYFLGFGRKLFKLKAFGVEFTVGFFLPIFSLFPVYEYENGQKNRVCFSWEFVETAIWKRFIVAIGGVLSTMLAGILIFIILAYAEKESYISKEEINKHGIDPSPLAMEAGFMRGDRVLFLNGQDFISYHELFSPQPETRYTILRDGQQVELTVSNEIISQFMDKYSEPFVSILAPYEITNIVSGSPAERAGLQAGDRIKSVNGTPVVIIQDLNKAIEVDEDGVLDLEIQRGKDTASILLSNVQVNEDKKLGVLLNQLVEYTLKQNTMLEAIEKGVISSFTIIASNVKGFYSMLSGETYKSTVKGPIGVKNVYGDDSLWLNFWQITAILAMWIAFYNVLPLPNSSILQIIPLLYEKVTGKLFAYTNYRLVKRIGIAILFISCAFVALGDLILFFS